MRDINKLLIFARWCSRSFRDGNPWNGYETTVTQHHKGLSLQAFGTSARMQNADKGGFDSLTVCEFYADVLYEP